MPRDQRSYLLPPISKYSSRAEWEVACWKKIIGSNEVLETVTTKREQQAIILRAAAIDRINAGKTYREIGNELWLSPQTISVIKKAMSENRYRGYRGRAERKKKIYSVRNTRKPKRRPAGRSVRTKYGTIYVPY